MTTSLEQPQAHPGNKSTIVGLAGFLIAIVVIMLSIFRVHGGDPSGPYLIGETSTANKITWPIPVTIMPGTDGFDGQYYLMLALDPFLRGGASVGLDRPEYRARRIALPLLAWISSAGMPGLIVWIFQVWSAVFVGLGTWAVARWAQKHEANPWWGLVYVFNLGVFVCLWRVIGDAWTTSMLLCAITCFALKRHGWGALTIAMALLNKETSLLLAAIILFLLILRREERKFTFYYIVGIAAAALWWIYATWAARDMESFGGTMFNFSMPIVGPIKALRLDFTASKALSHKIKDAAFILIHLSSILLGLAAGADALWRGIRQKAWDISGLAFGVFSLMAFFFSWFIWEEVWGYARILLPGMALMLVWGLANRRRDGVMQWIARLALLASGLGAMSGLAFAALQVLRGTP